MELTINLLGPLVIENGQRRLGKLPRKARALLAYLATQGGAAVSRERLADLLWPYQGSEHARHLVAEFANCRLQEVETDLERFERLSRSKDRAELAAASELYRGEFLADF